MTEPNIVKSKKQRIQEETAGSFFGALPQRYGKPLFIYYASSSIFIASRLISDATSSIHS